MTRKKEKFLKYKKKEIKVFKCGINTSKYELSNLGQQIDLVVIGRDSDLNLTLPVLVM